MAGKAAGRRKSRRKAFELLFELEQHPSETPESILERTFCDPDVLDLQTDDEDHEGYVTSGFSESSERFIRELVNAASSHKADLDLELEKHPHEWTFDRMGVPERVLLRLAVAEMVYIGTSYKVVINEALDLTKLYARDEARKFINGILGAVVANLPELQGNAPGYNEE